jgi:hypothetical protein
MFRRKRELEEKYEAVAVNGVAQIVIDVERGTDGAFEFVVRTRPELDAKTAAETLRFCARQLDEQS